MSRTSRVGLLAILSLLGAAVPHVPLAAQNGAAGSTDSAPPPETGLGAGVGAAVDADRMEMPFAGTYAITMALGRDTAQMFIRIPRRAEFQLLALPEKQRGKPRTPIGGLVVPVIVGTDTSGLPRSLGNEPPTQGFLLVSPDAAPGSGGTRWSVTLLAGADTTQATGVARLSRALLRLQQDRVARALACLTDPKAENDAARKLDLPDPCDIATRLPVERERMLADGMLYVSNDGQARVEQRIETGAGELTLWGSRVGGSAPPTGGPTRN